MPTYQYACTDCGEHLERWQAFTDEPLTECPACSGPLRKVFSSVGVVFKGSGFYRTDSRVQPEPAAAVKADGKADGKSDSSAPSGGDAKPAAEKSKSSENGTAKRTAAKPAGPAKSSTVAPTG